MVAVADAPAPPELIEAEPHRSGRAVADDRVALRADRDELAGVEIVGIISISESGGQQPQPIYMARAEMAMAADAGAATGGIRSSS